MWIENNYNLKMWRIKYQLPVKLYFVTVQAKINQQRYTILCSPYNLQLGYCDSIVIIVIDIP
jgi:hypothetical protein